MIFRVIKRTILNEKHIDVIHEMNYERLYQLFHENEDIPIIIRLKLDNPLLKRLWFGNLAINSSENEAFINLHDLMIFLEVNLPKYLEDLTLIEVKQNAKTNICSRY
jgi:hypothetical protein